MPSAELTSTRTPEEPVADPNTSHPRSRGPAALHAIALWLLRVLANSAGAWALAAGAPLDPYHAQAMAGEKLSTPLPGRWPSARKLEWQRRASGMPYLFIAGHEPEPGYRAWLQEQLPQVRIEVWPGSGHFPHLAHPDRFATCLASTGQWAIGQP